MSNSIDDDIIHIETMVIKHDHELFKENENILSYDIDRRRFYNILDDVFGYTYQDISRMIDGGVYTPTERQQFNIAIRELKQYYNIDIKDTIIYIEDSIPMDHILKFIDDETEWSLKNELISSNYIKDNSTTILSLFEN